MSNTVDEHQRQLSALHDVHRQTVAALKSSHSKSVDQLQKQLAALKSSAPDCSTAGKSVWHMSLCLLLPRFKTIVFDL